MHIRKQSEHFFWKIIDCIYWVCHSHSWQKLAYESEEWVAYSEGAAVFFKKCERRGVWAASCERTFGGIGKAKAASEGTKNNAHMQGKEQKRMFSVLSGVYWDQNVFFIFNKNDFLKQKYASLALATKIIKKYSKGVLVAMLNGCSSSDRSLILFCSSKLGTII